MLAFCSQNKTNSYKWNRHSTIVLKIGGAGERREERGREGGEERMKGEGVN